MDILNIAEVQKDFYKKGATRDYKFRLGALNVLKKSIEAHEQDIIDALKKDFYKSSFESYVTEISIVYSEINHFMKNVKKYNTPKFKFTEMTTWPSYGKIYPEPYGSTLIISPWNYPFMLSMSPLAAAICAGNTVVLKPSTDTPTVSSVMAKIIEEAFEPEFVTVINGSNEDTHKLLSQKFDYIFFTGSPSFGKKVMAKAAENLIPVTLELGGKSPCIVDEGADIKTTAKRVVWGKLINGGQTCIAPDYLLVHKSIKENLIIEMKKEIENMYGKNPMDSKDFPNIVNERSFNRLVSLLDGENIVYGGRFDGENLRIEPTIIDTPSTESDLRKEEIFGPILPIIGYEYLDSAIDYIKLGEKPLAFYYFGKDRKKKKYILENVSFGGGCFNDTIMHVASHSLPFGGVGNSGMGSYHGKTSFDTFTHYRSMLHRIGSFDVKQKFPPYSDKNLSLIKKFMK